MKGFLVLDGPTGTELIARGFKPAAEVWTGRAALDAPELLRLVHQDYLAAGANILTANTFRISSYSAAKAGIDAAEARRLVHASVALATEVVEERDGKGPYFIAGSLGPLEDCYHPAMAPELAMMERVHSEKIAWLLEAGCDLVLAETMGSAREALVAVRAAHKVGAAVAISFIPDESGLRLLGGDGLLDTARLCVESGAESVLVNCVHADVVERALAVLKPLSESGVVLGAYANASRMHVGFGGQIDWEPDPRPASVRAKEYAERAASWPARFNTRIIGSCCGTTPEYIGELSARLSS